MKGFYMEKLIGSYHGYPKIKQRQINIRTSKDIVDDLKVMAIRHNLSLNAYIERMFIRHIIKQKQYE